MEIPHNLVLPPLAFGARVGILGGSFDPPHLCHQLLALSFLAVEELDELWVIPCANHAYKAAATDFHHRLAMCTIAFARLNQVRVLDLEDKLPAPNYTIETLRAILNLRPDLKLLLCLGSDLIDGFPTWHEADEIVKLADIGIFERANYPIKTLPKILQGAHAYQGYALPDAASTNLRDVLSSQDRPTSKQFLDREVRNYITKNHLYN
ncbi:MAG TPA: nicotinate-nicotinamide nucleotide adenylyltransferase [Myxococcota bacterium]|nr:nicotinate-nicotinamide nucleotide adenylyltransferase [Myxococcota bacterium]